MTTVARYRYNAFLFSVVAAVLFPIQLLHDGDVIMSALASQITSVSIVYSTVCPGADQRKHQSSASRACVWGIHRPPVNSPHRGPVTRKRFPFDDVIMRIWEEDDGIAITNIHFFYMIGIPIGGKTVFKLKCIPDGASSIQLDVLSREISKARVFLACFVRNFTTNCISSKSHLIRH